MRPVNFECPVEITKAYEEKGRWIVEGYAATTDFDMQEDIITEEAISASAKDLLENSTVLHNHNPDEAIGKVLESQARPGGLFLKILISKTAPEIWQQVQEGVLNKFSVRGKILEARKEWVERLKKFARLILKMRLVEVSLVAVPANPKARAIRWYVEKALAEFEKAGGRIETTPGCEPQGGSDMKNEVVVEEELLEATGEPEADAVISKSESPPGQAAKERNPHLQLVDELIAGEADEERKRMLAQIRALVAGAGDAAASARKEDGAKDEPNAASNGAASLPAEVEKAGRKISSSRLARLKKLLEELKGFIDEVDEPAPSEKKAAEGESPPDKLAEIEGTVAQIAKTLGIAPGKDGEKKPALAETVESLAKRLDALEKAPGARTSLDGQEALAGEGDSKSVWKGLI
jgi:HK97 family phage prohead protease